MKYHNGKICLEYAEIVPNILSKAAYDQAKNRGTIVIHGRGGNGNGVLIDHDSLPKKYKDLVRAAYGDLDKCIATKPIKELINWDLKAESFYSNYVLPNGMKLPDDYVAKYAMAATWLNTITHLTTDKRQLKTLLNKSISEFWCLITELIRAERIHLPTHEKRLKEKVKSYSGQNYECLIEAFRFGNSNSKKVDDDIAQALLLELLAHDHQHDYTIVAAKYNQWAIESGKATITRSAVNYWAKKNAHLITQSREGKAANYGKFNKQIMRERPSAPLLLINSDDNVLDLYFINEKANKHGYLTKNHYYRPVLYIVTDAYNDYVLGYAVGEEVTIELIKEAYRNAANHIKQLLNGYYLPFQLQTDRWGLGKDNELERFYKSMGVYTPATARVAQGKYIERSFGTVWHQTLKQFINYAGQNITSKERLSPEAIERNRSNFPPVSEAPKQIALFIESLRQMPTKQGISRQQQWLDAFSASEKSQQQLISEEKHLQIFGKQHLQVNSLRPDGLRLQINNRQLIYDIPTEYFPQHIGKKVQVFYDPYDMSKVLVTDGKGIRFVAETYQKMPSAIADHTPETRQRLFAELENKKRISAMPVEAQNKRKEILRREQIDAESLLQSGNLIKQIRHAAERTVQITYKEIETKGLMADKPNDSLYDRL